MIKYIFLLILYLLNYHGKEYEKIENYKLRMDYLNKFKVIKL